MAKNKKYNVKIYDSSGALLSTIQPRLILDNEVEFNSQLNGGVGVCDLVLNLTFDDFENEVNFVDVHNSIRIFQFDDIDNIDGKLIFTGEILQYTPVLSAEREVVVLVCSGLSSLFNVSSFKDGSSFAPSYTGVDPSEIAKDIVDQVQALNSFLVYDDTVGPDQTVFSVGKSVDFNFDKGKTWFEAMEQVIDLAGDGWFWFVDGQGNFWFREKPSSPSHILQIGRDVLEIVNEVDGTQIVNDVTVEYSGALTFNKTDPSSISLYGTREKYIVDANIGNAIGAESRADKELEKSDVVRRVSINVSSQYNFEDIKVGDTLKVRGVKSGSVVLDDNSLIVGFTYTPDVMILQLGQYSSLATEIVKIA